MKGTGQIRLLQASSKNALPRFVKVDFFFLGNEGLCALESASNKPSDKMVTRATRRSFF